MTPNELYALPPVRRTNRIYALRHFFPKVNFDDIQVEELPRLELQYYADHNFDGERTWELFVVALDNQPFMVCQTAGRGGEDHQNDFVTDGALYKDAQKYLLEQVKPETEDDTFNPNEDIPNLTRFYNHVLDEFYDPNLKPKYKVGDVVLANVPQNHLHNPREKVITRVEIVSVNQFNPSETYRGKQIDRRWGDCSKVPWEMVTDPNNGNIGAALTDDDIVMIAPTECRRTACKGPDPICRHTQTGEYYCVKCARNINRLNPEVPNLIHIPRN